MNETIRLIKAGSPIYMRPYKEPKAWGVKGIGEYWYGAEHGEKGSRAYVNNHRSFPLIDILESIPEDILGKDVIKIFGRRLPLMKILTPKGRLSVQFHDAKSELWVVTGIDRTLAGNKPQLIIGFNHEALEKHGAKIKDSYKKALKEFGQALNILLNELLRKKHKDLLDDVHDILVAARKLKDKDEAIAVFYDRLMDRKKKMEDFYNYVKVETGDVLPVPQGTLHALGPGIEVIEPQIPGPTQALEDGVTYPIRYNFPEYPSDSAVKELDIERVHEMNMMTWKKIKPRVKKKARSYQVELLPGGFEKKGMEVNRITISDGAVISYDDVKSYHTFVAIKGTAQVVINDKSYHIPKAYPGGEMLLVPASAGSFKVKAEKECQVIDTFTPVGKE